MFPKVPVVRGVSLVCLVFVVVAVQFAQVVVHLDQCHPVSQVGADVLGDGMV